MLKLLWLNLKIILYHLLICLGKNNIIILSTEFIKLNSCQLFKSREHIAIGHLQQIGHMAGHILYM